jgi:hypothetical protein
LSNNKRPSTEEIIAIQDIVLEYVLSNYWKDYQQFVRDLSERILEKRPKNETSLTKLLNQVSHPFYSFNGISRKEFVSRFPTREVIHRIKNMPKSTTVRERIIVTPPQPTHKKKCSIKPIQVFPEISKIDLNTARALIKSLDIPERVVQDALRDALREKGATNMIERKSDTSLEIADLEDFTLDINGHTFSFTSVVKGYRSINSSKVSFKDIAHQIMKANATNPDYILLILAKPIKDGVITGLVKYGIDCGNRNLIILIDQIDLARFLRVRKII